MKHTYSHWSSSERRLAQFEAFLKDSRNQSSIRYRRIKPRTRNLAADHYFQSPE